MQQLLCTCKLALRNKNIHFIYLESKNYEPKQSQLCTIGITLNEANPCLFLLITHLRYRVSVDSRRSSFVWLWA